MRRVSFFLAVAASAASVATAGAQGSNTACTSAGGGDTTSLTFNSTSNSADKTQIQCTHTADGATLVLTAVSRFNGANLTPPPVLETAPGSGIYDAMYGHSNPTAGTPFPNMAVWNFNFAALNTNSGDTYRLLIDQDPSTGTSFLACVLGTADACNLGLQDSENLGFPFADPSNTFDPSAPGDYTFALQELNSDHRVVGAVSIDVVVGTPEPATFALMGTGLLGLGGFVRRRNKKVA